METMEIYYDDLNEEAKKVFDETFGLSDTFNHETCPLAIYEQEENEENEE